MPQFSPLSHGKERLSLLSSLGTVRMEATLSGPEPFGHRVLALRTTQTQCLASGGSPAGRKAQALPTTSRRLQGRAGGAWPVSQAYERLSATGVTELCPGSLWLVLWEASGFDTLASGQDSNPHTCHRLGGPPCPEGRIHQEAELSPILSHVGVFAASVSWSGGLEPRGNHRALE